MKNHPQIKDEKIGVLIINLGTPDATDYLSVRKYLSEFLSDKRVIDYPAWLWQPLLQGIILSIRPFRSGAAYKKIWNEKDNESPLKTHTRNQYQKIEKHLKNKNIIFDWAMRYGNPSIEHGLNRLKEKGARKILLFALYPQYSACTTASAYDKAFDVLKEMTWQPSIRTASDWYDDDDYIELLAASVTKTLKTKKTKHVICSFHGLPERYLKQGDPYHCLCVKTSRLVQEKLGWDKEHWHTTFQSRFGSEKWLEPYTDETVISLAKKGIDDIAVISPAFVSECIETLEEIDIELRQEFLDHGGKNFTYIPCLNDNSKHIEFLSKKIMDQLSGWPV